MKKRTVSLLVLSIPILGIVFLFSFDYFVGARAGTSASVLVDLVSESLTDSICSEEHSPVHPSLNEQEITEYTAAYPSGIGRAEIKSLRAIIDKSRCQKYTPVTLRVGPDNYKIPMNYLTAWGDYESQKIYNSGWADIFLPDYNGYDRKNFIDTFDPLKIEARWYSESSPPGPEVEIGIKRLIKYGVLNLKPELAKYELDIYAHSPSVNNKITGVGTSKHGHTVQIKCSTTALNNRCQMEYHHKTNGYWVYVDFHLAHLSNWRHIDEQINEMIVAWRAEANAKKT